TFCSDARAHDGLALCHGVQNLEPRASSNAKRHDVDGRAFDPRTHIGYEARYLDGRILRCRRTYSRAWSLADRQEFRVGHLLFDARPDRIEEPFHRIAV